MPCDRVPPNRFWLILVVLLLFSLGIRLWTVSHGLPYIQVTDENSDLSTALRLFQSEIPSRNVRYHRSLIAYINVLSIGAFFGYSRVVGQVDSLENFRELYFSNRADFTLATRLTFTLLTTLTIVLVALTGRFLSGTVGLLAAALLAVNGFFTLNSAYAMPDTLVMFTTALCLWLTMRLYHKKRRQDYFLAGIGLALVMLSKLNAAPAGIGIVVAHIAVVWRCENHRFWLRRIFNYHILWLILGMVLGNLLFNPLAFFYPSDLIYEIQRLSGYAYTTNLSSIADRFLLISDRVSDAVQLAWRWLLPASIVGVIAVARFRDKPTYWIVLSVFVVLLITIANIVNIYYKVFYWTPWLIPMTILSAIGLVTFIEFLMRYRLQVFAFAAIVAILVFEGMFTLNLSSKMVQSDTRVLALEYIEANYPANIRIISGAPIV